MRIGQECGEAMCLHAKPVESQADGSSVGNSFAISAKNLKCAYIMYLGVLLLGISSQGIIRDVGRMRTLRIILMEKSEKLC